MGFLGGCPLIYHISILIRHDQLRPRQFLSGRQVGLADLHRRYIIFHHDFLNFSRVFNGKLNAFRGRIAVRRLCLDQGVRFSNFQFFDNMGFLSGCPLIYYISIHIHNLHLRSRKFLSGRQVGLCDFHRSRFILESELKCLFFDIFALPLHGKLTRLSSGHKTSRCVKLLHIAGRAHRKVCHKINASILIRCFQFNDFACRDQHGTGCRYDILRCEQAKNGSFQSTVCIFFGLYHTDGYLLAFILPVLVIDDHGSILILIAKVHITDFIVQYITAYRLDFFHIILPDRKPFQLRRAGLVRCDGRNKLVRAVIIRAHSVRCFDILCRVNFKGHI